MITQRNSFHWTSLNEHSEELKDTNNKEALVLYGGRIDNKRRVSIICTTFVMQKQNGKDGHYHYSLGEDENTSLSIVKFFRWLHPFIVAPSKPKHSDEPVLTPQAYGTTTIIVYTYFEFSILSQHWSQY